jgi:hypothetical protein
VDGSFPDDAAIQHAFRGLGLELRFATNPDGTSIDPVTFTDSAGKTHAVSSGSTGHYRHLAQREVKNPATHIENEIHRNCIFVGASTQFDSNIFANRTDNGSIRVVVHQPGIDKLLPCAQLLVTNIGKKGFMNIVDLKQTYSQDRPVYLVAGGSTISRGNIQRSKIRSTISRKAIEFWTFMATVLLLCTTFGLYSIPLERSIADNGRVILLEPLSESVRYFATNTWPAAGMAALTLAATLLISVILAPRNKISWSWRD